MAVIPITIRKINALLGIAAFLGLPFQEEIGGATHYLSGPFFALSGGESKS
jgi:hypothetical protein